jgi:hypothetical protein
LKEQEVAQKVQVLLTDDLDGSDAVQTVRFGWLGADYEIDLNDKNFTAFEKALSKYVAAARKTGGGARSRASKKQTSSVDLATVRAWARDNGYEISDRGRVSGSVMDAYRAATGS